MRTSPSSFLQLCALLCFLSTQGWSAVIEVTAGGSINDPTYRFSDEYGQHLANLTATNGMVTSSGDLETGTGNSVNNLATRLAAAEATITSLTSGAVPGEMRMFAGQSAPTEWLMCDGAAVSRTTYSSLFAAIGVAYGAGDGSTTFNVPDLRGRSPLGAGLSTASGVQRGVGTTGGAETHLLQSSELPSHTHSFSQSVSTSSAGGHSHTYSTSAAGGHSHTFSTNSHGGHNHGYPLSDPQAFGGV